MNDPTENARRQLVEEINNSPDEREELEREHGKVWDTAELQQDFDVQSFLAPFVLVRRKSDGVMGTLKFQHQPRYYFTFEENPS